MSAHRKNLTASEIGTYVFCPRAWALKQLGYPSDNLQAMNEGTEFHHRFGMRARIIRILQALLFLVIICLAVLILRYFLK